MPEPDFLGDAPSIQHRDRASFVAIGRGVLRVDDRGLVFERMDGTLEIPVGMISAILLEPGANVTHEAVKLASDLGTLLVWVGEAGVRVYSVGEPGGKHAQRLIHQVQQHLDHDRRMAAAQRLYRLMFNDGMPATRSLDKLRGFEGARVKAWYAEIAERHGVPWTGREQAEASLKDALGFGTSCLYGLAEAVIVTAGYSPAIGIVHSGNTRSLVFDLADTVKFRTVVPTAFSVYAESPLDVRNRVRRACRDLFREERTAAQLFDNLFEILGDDVRGIEP